MGQLLRELQRRNVIRVAAAYLVVGWIVMQVVDVIGSASGMPDWASSFALIILVVGLPVVLFVAWAFELTPEGIKQTAAVPEEESRTAQTGQALNIAILGAIVVLIVIIGWRQLAPSEDAPTQDNLPVAEAGTAEDATESVEIADALSAADPAMPPDRSLAVLPFASFSAEDRDQYFADGLTEEILNSLAAIPDLLVTSRTSAFQFRGDNLPAIPEIASRLGVAHILEGSVRSVGNQVRVTAQLIRASDDSHLWSQTYDRSLDDVFAIQEDIAENVASVLEVVIDEAERERMRNAGARNVEAFIAYQRGLELWRELHDEDGHERLVEANVFFAEATRLDPDFSEAYLLQSDHFAHVMLDLADAPVSAFDQEAFDAARAEHVRLLQLAESAASTPLRSAIAEANDLLFSEDWSRAQPLLDIIASSSGCAADNWVNSLAALGHRSVEILEFYERQTQCDPLNPQSWTAYESAAVRMGDYETGIRAHRRHLELGIRRSNDGFLRFEYLLSSGRLDELEALLADSGMDPFGQQFFGMKLAAARGERETAQAIRETFLAMDNFPPEGAMVMAALLGDRETANAAAAEIDSRPLNFLTFSQAIGFCNCGAPFDIEAAPNFRARLQEARFPWPPESSVDYPLKDW